MIGFDLTSRTISPLAVRLMRYAVASASIFNFLVLLPLWLSRPSVIELVFPFPGSGLWYGLAHLLYHKPFGIHLAFLGLYLCAAIGLYFRKLRVICCLLLVFLGHNLISQSYPYLNMSQYLLVALTTYLLFMDEKADERKGTLGVASRGLTNTFYIICWAQVLAAYVFPFYYKVQGEMWLNGTALGTILSIPEFSRSFLTDLADPHHWLFKWLTWSTLFYQAAFPILIWWKKAKPFLLVAGVLFNLGIGLFMGLVDIAVVMIAAYAILLDQQTIATLRSWLPKFNRRRAAGPSSLP